jgi:hypothetical protein
VIEQRRLVAEDLADAADVQGGFVGHGALFSSLREARRPPAVRRPGIPRAPARRRFAAAGITFANVLLPVAVRWQAAGRAG